MAAECHNILGHAVLLTSVLAERGADAERYLIEHVLPAALPYFDPIQVAEPAIGSGVMLLALASTVPWWANHFGLVQYAGMDIDLLCVRMSRVQTMLYGLNGYAARCVAAATGQELRVVASQVEKPVDAELPAAEPLPFVSAPVPDTGLSRPQERAVNGIRKVDSGLIVQHGLFEEEVA